MIIKEFRVTLPLTVEEYHVAQLHSVVEASRDNTGGGEGIEIIKNEPFENYPLLSDYSSGQYTFKIYRIGSRIPAVVRFMLPEDRLVLHEEAWNAYPYCRTIMTNPGTDRIKIQVETIHLADRGDTENAHQLPPELLEQREVVHIDIANDIVEEEDYEDKYDPVKFLSKKTKRGQLTNDWRKNCEPVMTCYKLVRAEFRYFGVQGRIENYILNAQRRIFLKFHRQLFCSIDQWFGLTLDDIRKAEKELQDELREKILQGTVRGTKFESTI